MSRRMLEKIKERMGFTLIELMVVLALLGSATALAAPNVMDAFDGSKDKADAAQMDFLLNAFQMRQAPFYDSHTNAYDMLNPAYANADGTQDAEQALNLFLADVQDASSDVYIEGVQCVTKEQAKMNDGTPVFQAESSDEMLWISCKMDGNRSNAEIRIPGTNQIAYEYSAGEGIRWGDSLLYIGDYENLESRFVADTCMDYQLEAGFHLDNQVHQNGDHKSHMGLIFNYIDDQNFCLIDLQLKNGTKQMNVYQVVNGSWSELDKNIGIGQDYNLPGNRDYTNNIEFHTRMTVWNSVSGISKVKVEMAQIGVDGGNYDEVFTRSYSIADSEKSSQYAFYIGEPAGNQLKEDGVIIGYKDQNESIDPDDPATYEYEDVQIQLLSYPTFLCANEDGSYDEGGSSGDETSITITEPDFYSNYVAAHSTPSVDVSNEEKFQYQFYKNGSWQSDWDDSGDFTAGVDKDKVRIRVLRSTSVAAGPAEFEKGSAGADFGIPSFTYNYNNDNTPITIMGTENSIEYLWIDGISNDTQPGDGENGTESGMNQISPSGLGSKTGWLWAREYDSDGHGSWVETPWVGSDEFDDPGLTGILTGEGYKVICNISFSGMILEYLGGSNSAWGTNSPIIPLGTETVRARVKYNGTQVSYEIQNSDFNVPEEPESDPFSVEVIVRYQNSNFSKVTFTPTDNCVIEYQTDKSFWQTARQKSEITLIRKSSWIEVKVTYDGIEKTLMINNLNSNTYTIE